MYECVRKVIVDEFLNYISKFFLLYGDLWGGNYMFLING